MGRFIRPETAVLRISNGDTLTVKKRLSAGEQRAMFAQMYVPNLDGVLKVNPLATGLARMIAYLVDWSLTDDSGQRVVIAGQPIDAVTSALDALAPEDFAEIKDAIEAHEVAMLEEREAQKKTGGATSSAATLPSPVGSGGATSGSVN